MAKHIVESQFRTKWTRGFTADVFLDDVHTYVVGIRFKSSWNLTFSNPLIIKHPDYKSIRLAVLRILFPMRQA